MVRRQDPIRRTLTKAEYLRRDGQLSQPAGETRRHLRVRRRSRTTGGTQKTEQIPEREVQVAVDEQVNCFVYAAQVLIFVVFQVERA